MTIPKGKLDHDDVRLLKSMIELMQRGVTKTFGDRPPNAALIDLRDATHITRYEVRRERGYYKNG